MRVPARWRAVALGVVALAALTPRPLSAAQARPPRPQASASAASWSLTLLDTAVLTAPRLSESSGLVASRSTAGVYWTHNDSGDLPFLYATDSTGGDLGAIRVAGAEAVDWEDIAFGPCVRRAPYLGTGRAGGCIYIGDIGDNLARRASVTIYRVSEPVPPRDPADTARTTLPADVITLRYPDHPHDAEGLFVHPASGEIFVVTKDRTGPPLLFRAPAPPQPLASVELKLVGVVPMAEDRAGGYLVTGADISADGSLIVMRTYVSIHLFRLTASELLPLLGPQGLALPVREAQGEAVAFDRGGVLVLSSERGLWGHGILTRLRLLESP